MDLINLHNSNPSKVFSPTFFKWFRFVLKNIVSEDTIPRAFIFGKQQLEIIYQNVHLVTLNYKVKHSNGFISLFAWSNLTKFYNNGPPTAQTVPVYFKSRSVSNTSKQ